MMNQELEALARRAVACKGWRWMAGMLACVDVPLPHFGGAVRLRVVKDDEAWGGPVGAPVDALPDLTDPATLGCLLALVREAWGGQVDVCVGDGWWDVEADDEFWNHDNTLSLEAALISALESAP